MENGASHVLGNPILVSDHPPSGLVLENGLPADANHCLEISPEQIAILLADGIVGGEELLKHDYVSWLAGYVSELRPGISGKVKDPFGVFIEKNGVSSGNFIPVRMRIFGKISKKFSCIHPCQISLQKNRQLSLDQMVTPLNRRVVDRLEVGGEADDILFEPLGDVGLGAHDYFYHPGDLPFFKRYILFINKMHDLAEEQRDNVMAQEQFLESSEENAEDEQMGEENEEEEETEEGSLLLPITGLIVVILCEVALFISSLNHFTTAFSPREL